MFSPDIRACLFGGPVVWPVFSPEGPATCMRELCAACNDLVGMVIGLLFRKFCILEEYPDKGSRCLACFLWR